MKTKKRRQSRKKRVGGASGLVLIVEYDRYGNIKTRKLQKMLARHEYMNLNKVDPGTSLSEGIRESFDLDRMQQIFLNFLNIPNDHGPERKTQKNRVVKIALNDKSDIRLIQLVNKVISRLNKIKNKRAEKKLFIIRDKAGKLTKDTKLEFRKKYEEMLAGAFIEDYKIQKKDVDEELLKLLMRMPVLMNLVSIKYGLMNSGEMTLEELQDIYNLDNDRILELVKPEKKARPDVMTYDEILEEENEKLAKQNEELKKKLSGGLNEENESDLVLLDELGEAFAEASAEGELDQKNVVSSDLNQGVSNTSLNSNLNQITKTTNQTPVAPSNSNSNQPPVPGFTSNQTQVQGPNSNQPLNPNPTPPAGSNLNPVQVAASTSNQLLANNNPRVKAIEQFNKLLLKKYGGDSDKVDAINENMKEFHNIYPNSSADPVKLMQYYLIKNILVCIGVYEDDLYTTKRLKNDSNKRQATILLMIRFLLTKDMTDFDTFKEDFEITKLCNTFKSAANKQSSILGQFARRIGLNTNYSYDKIIGNIKNLCPAEGQKGDPNYDAMITIHLNKLYDLFQTKDPKYIQDMVTKSYGNKVTTVDNYDETYNTSGTNQNYIFS